MNTDIIEQAKNTSPIVQIDDKESDMIVLKMGSFLSIINNKKINQAKLLVTVLKNKKFQDCFLQMMDFDNLQTLVECIIKKYPLISKSKVVYKAVKNKHANTTRKKSV
jgi:hypothetical protein